MAVFGTNQAVIQRALGTKSLSRARWSYIMAAPLLFIAQLLSVAVGWVLFAFYASTCCDPLANVAEVANRPDNVLPYFIMEVIDYPTVPGFFFGAVLSGSLSTISSSVNAASAIIWDDVLSGVLRKKSELVQSVVRKTISLLFGGLVIGVSFILDKYKSSSTLLGMVVSVFGALQGPVMAMFMFAAFIPISSGIGTLVGGICAVVISLWMTIGRTELGIKFQLLPLPDGGCGMSNATCSLDESLLPGSANVDWFRDLDWFYSISFFYYPLISIIVVFVIGSMVTMLTSCSANTKVKYLFPVVRLCATEKDTAEGVCANN